MTLNAVVSSFDESLDQIAKLVAYYKTNAQAYLAVDYKEAQIRQNLIDPFFIALGWDVHNSRKIAPQYCPVVVEPSLDMEGQMKAPDYAFRIGQTTKFFTEAKKIGVSIKNDPRPAYQLRSYAWSAKLPLSLLTDFEELSVYDCRFRPANTDKVTAARINYYTCEQYPDHWREIWDVFSYEALLSGAFDDYAQAEKPKRGTSEVDDEFLKEIEQWRDQLARNIALRNPALSIEEMNDAVQRTIDRIVFLRMAEDRGIEDDEQLQRLARQDDIYPSLVKLFRKADAKYNSGLFDFTPKGDRLTAGLSIDDKVLRGILNDLYYPQSPYRFNVMPVEILGNVYEQFLGKVIRLTPAHQAKVEEKPEVKKAGGVYYTPSYIVDYIVRNTVGRQVEGKTPRQIADLHVLDMACGSGSFLLGAYDYLLDYYLKWYMEHDPAKHKQAVWQKGAEGEWKLTIAEKKRILTTHLFGVDIDRQAVEVTKLSLLLKVLEGESDESLGEQLPLFSERVLPNLDRNIKCGNSLIGPDYFAGQLMPDEDSLRRINAFDWASEFPEVLRAGGFDCIIGNPPYIRIQTMKEWAPLEVEIYKQLYQSAGAGNYDIYVVFVEKGLSLLNPEGRLGFILPSKFFSTDYGAGLRQVITNRKALTQIIDFGHAQVFNNATTYTCLLFLSGSRSDSVCYAAVQEPAILTSSRPECKEFPASTFNEESWKFGTDTENAIVNKITQGSVQLIHLPSDIARGTSSGADDIFILTHTGNGYITRRGEPVEVEEDICRTPVYATDFSRYSFAPKNGEVIIFPYDVNDDGYVLKSESELRRFFPKAYRYLLSRRKELETRKQYKTWYGFSAPRSLNVHDKAQMLVPLLADRGLYCRLPNIKTKYCLMASGGFSITIQDSHGLSSDYVFGLLNSRLLFWRLRSISNVFRGGWITCTKQYVETLPIKILDLNLSKDKARHDQMVSLVQQILELHKRLQVAHSDQDRQLYQRQIDATDKQIDALVYELYGLSDDEIRIVEESSR